VTGSQAATFSTNSGKSLLAAGNLDEAIAQFRNAIKLSPTYAPAHYQLALALTKKGKQDEAAEEFKKAAQLDSRLKAPTP
jgi:Flp pilus assembly protein TadD